MRFLNNYKHWLIKSFHNIQYSARLDSRVLIVLIIITTFIIAVIAIAVILTRQALIRRRRQDLSGGNSGKNLKMFLYLGALMVGLLFIFSLSLPLSDNSNVCGKTCHEMNPAFQSWLRSAHAAVPCQACHSESGPTELSKIPLASLFKKSSKNIKIINADSRYSQTKIPNQKCLKCHSPANRKFNVRLGLNMSGKIHNKHLNAKLRCTTCHNRVAHPQAEKYNPIKQANSHFKYKDFLKMTTGCWRCHRKGRTFINIADKRIGAPYKAPNGAVAPTKCNTCHNQDWNKNPAMHKADDLGRPWTSGLVHGPIARDNFNDCLGCHDKNTWCSTRCHKGVTMPHNKKTWLVAHRSQAKKDRQLCNMCHEAEPDLNFCTQRCHHDKFRKQFKLASNVSWRNGEKQHGVAAVGTKGQPCFRCHDQKTTCTTQCHGGMTMPHVPNWKKVHFDYVTFIPNVGFKPDLCDMCHNKGIAPGNTWFCFDCHHKEFKSKVRKFYPVEIMRLSDNLQEGTIPYKGPCAKCHRAMGMCRRCHEGGNLYQVRPPD